MIINPYVYAGLDPDAQAFLTAASITDATITSAINTLCLDLKGNNLWSKMFAIYPFVGGTATTHKWNLKDPQDTNAAYRMTFSGGWVHDANGITGNAINTLGNSNLNASLIQGTKGSIGIYSRTNINANYYDMSNLSGGTEQSVLSRWSNNLFYVNSGSATYPNTANLDSRGLFSLSFNAQVKGYKNGSHVITETKASTGVNNVYYVGGFSGGGISGRNYAFAFISDELNNSEMSNLYTNIQNFQTTLSRNV